MQELAAYSFGINAKPPAKRKPGELMPLFFPEKAY